jgi:hypothetical protein
MRADFGGSKIDLVQVDDGPRSWRSLGGEVKAVSEDERKRSRAEAHAERVAGLLPLLRDKSLTLRIAADDKVEGRPVKVVKVVKEGKPDVLLAFDRESGLLVRCSYRAHSQTFNREALHEALFRGYRLVYSGGAEEQALRSARVGTDDKALLAFLREQVPGPAALARARALVKQLGADEFEEREKAEAALLRLGPIALPFLREAAKRKGDLEVVRRAQRLLAAIKDRGNPDLTRAAVRLLALRRVPGAAEALLELLPGADQPIAEEARAALAELAGDARAREKLRAVAASDKGAAGAAARAALGLGGGADLARPGRRLYRPGLRLPMRQTLLIDGKVMLDVETTEVELFNRLEDKVFARP